MTSKMKVFSSEQGWLPVLGRGCGRAVLNTDDPVHAEQRRMLAPALTGSMIQSHWPAIESALDDWVAGLEDGMEFDAYPRLASSPFSRLLARSRACRVRHRPGIPPDLRRARRTGLRERVARTMSGGRTQPAARSQPSCARSSRIAGGSALRSRARCSTCSWASPPSPKTRIPTGDQIVPQRSSSSRAASTGATMFSRRPSCWPSQPAIADLLAGSWRLRDGRQGGIADLAARSPPLPAPFPARGRSALSVAAQSSTGRRRGVPDRWLSHRSRYASRPCGGRHESARAAASRSAALRSRALCRCRQQSGGASVPAAHLRRRQPDLHGHAFRTARVQGDLRARRGAAGACAGGRAAGSARRILGRPPGGSSAGARTPASQRGRAPSRVQNLAQRR